MAKTTVGVKLDEATRARLKNLGEVKQRSPHWLMCEAIDRYLDAEEQYEKERMEDQERWERYVETGRHLSLEEMRTRLKALASQAEELSRSE